MFSDEEKDQARKAAEAAFVGMSTWEEAVRADCVAAGADVRLHHVADAMLAFTANLLAARGGTMTAERRHELADYATTHCPTRPYLVDTGLLLQETLGEIAALGARNAVLEAEVSRLTQYEADLGSRFDALASKYSVAQEQIADLERSVETARSDRDRGAAAYAEVIRERDGYMKVTNERDAAFQQVEALGRNFEEACQKAEALREQLEAEREAKRELVRRAQQAEAEADKSEAGCAHVEADLKDAKATLEMYRNAWKRELGAFLRWKAHEIDALVVSTKRVVDMARDSETWRTRAAEYDTERKEAWSAYRRQDARANEAEDEVDRVSTERDALKARVAELEERCARLSVAGQALSDHADKTAGGPLTEEEAARNAHGHNGATP